MKRFLATVLLGCGVLVTTQAEAATVYLDPSSTELKRGDSVTMAIRLDVDELAGECVNALDAIVSYQDGIQPVDVSLGDSIFRVWVEEPTIDAENNRITFAGGIPNGYCGRIEGDPSLTNIVAEIVFSSTAYADGNLPEEPDTATVAFSAQSAVYLNDGQGNQAPLRTVPATVTLLTELGGDSNPWLDEVAADTTPPGAFSIKLEQYDTAFGGKYYIVFNTTDKQTGIDHYEVIEEPLGDLNLFRFGAADAPWIQTRSPYVLRDQSLNSTIRVKAVDNAGNEYIATLVPDESLRTTTFTQWLSAGITVLFLLLIVCGPLYLIIRRMRARNKPAPTSVPESPVPDYSTTRATREITDSEKNESQSEQNQ